MEKTGLHPDQLSQEQDGWSLSFSPSLHLPVFHRVMSSKDFQRMFESVRGTGSGMGVGQPLPLLTVCTGALVVQSLALGIFASWLLDPLDSLVAIGPSSLSGRTHCSHLHCATVTVDLGQGQGGAAGSSALESQL